MNKWPTISNAAEAVAVLRPAIPKRLLNKQECFVASYLDAKHRSIKKPTVVAIGSLASVDVHPRDIFREAIRLNCAAIIVAHNHPSGELLFSLMDKTLTARVKQVGELLGIPLLDSIIITKDGYRSLAETEGL